MYAALEKEQCRDSFSFSTDPIPVISKLSLPLLALVLGVKLLYEPVDPSLTRLVRHLGGQPSFL